MDCPELYRLNYIEEIEIPQSPSMALWTAAHLLIEWGMTAMNKKYRFLEKGERKNSKENKLEKRTFLTGTEADKIMILYDEVHRQPMFDIKWEYEKEKVLKHEGLKATMDRINVEKGVIRDLKFIHKLDRFKEDYFSPLWFNYQLQAIFYTYVANMVYGKEFQFLFDCVTHSGQYWCFEYKPTIQDFDMLVTQLDLAEKAIKAKEFAPKEFRDGCINCRYYKHCKKTALQSEITLL